MVIKYLKCLTLIAVTSIVFADLYEFEFIEAKMHRPRPKFPDNFVTEMFDFGNQNIEQTDEGTLILNGYVVLKKSSDKEQPVSIEMFKKERGTYQPTIINIKRADFCLMLFDTNDVLFDYVKQTPIDQFKCPFFEGQQITSTVSEAIYINLPTRNAEGEYIIHAEVGNNTDMTSFFCTEIPAYLHKV